MTNFKVLVQEIDGDGKAHTVWASEIRRAKDIDEAVSRFITGYITVRLSEIPARRTRKIAR